MDDKARMPLRWKGDLPDGLRCVVRAGLRYGRLEIVIARGPVGTQHPEIRRTRGPLPVSPGLHWRTRITQLDGYRPLCGTASKDIVAIAATLDDGQPAATDLIEADDLPFNLFLVWATPERWVASAEGIDDSGASVSQVKPSDPHELFGDMPQG